MGDGDVGGIHEDAVSIFDVAVGAAEHDVFARGFEEVVSDGVVAGAVPSADGLGVLVIAVNVGDVGVFDGGGAAIESESAGVIDIGARSPRLSQPWT